MAKFVEIDARLLDKSGIGRYIRSLISLCPFKSDVILRVSKFATALGGWTLIDDQSRLYSIGEQFSRIDGNALLRWTPHYNFPVLADGIHVVTVHDAAHLALPSIFGRGLKRLYAKLYFELIALFVDHVIFISQFTRDEFIRVVGREPKKYSIILNGVGGEWFTDAVIPKPSLHFRFDVQRVLVVGNVKPHKNLARLIAALRPLGITDKIQLRIVGKRDGFLTGEVAFATEDWIEWLGAISDHGLQDEYARADCFVMPSLYEGFGLPVLEAMASGCIVAASRIPAIVEVCGAVDSGVVEFFDPFNELDIKNVVSRALDLSVAERERRIIAGRQHAKTLSWDVCAHKTWALLARVIAHAKGVIV